MPAAVAVVLWSMAPVLVKLAERVPPLELTTLCVGVAAVATAAATRIRGAPAAAAIALPVRLGAALMIVGALGLYFAALRLAPPAEAALVTYTWPVLFVVIAELGWRRRIRPAAIAGLALAFGGAAVVLVPHSGAAAGGIPWAGYACALGSGACWASFSLLAGRQSAPLADRMPGLFVLAALCAGLGHGVFETTLWPLPGELALSIVLIGAGPYGLAFLAWDAALRRGPSATVGTLAYAVPVLSAALLVMAGMAAAHWRLPVAATAVIAGCIAASCHPRGGEGTGPGSAAP